MVNALTNGVKDMHMNRVFKRILISMILTMALLAQNSISGVIVDAKTNDPLVGANVVIKGTFKGNTTNTEGRFTISNVNDGSYTLVASFVGYKTAMIEDVSSGQSVDIKLNEEIYGESVVVTASRKRETMLESAVSIEQMDLVEIQNAPKANFYEAIGNLKAIDITTASMNMPVINMRGFNSTSPDRFVQFVDGMDNQAPALNFPVGNMVGMSELDIENVEVVYGAASALYGPNAFNGVLSMKSKSPWEYRGFSARIKTGSRKLFDGAFRYAGVVNDKFAYKVNLSYMQADDWEATNPQANRYGALGDVSTGISSTVLPGLLATFASGTPQGNLFRAYQAYMNGNGYSFNNINNTITNSYAEKDIVDYETRNLKVNTSLHYLIDDQTELSYTFNYGLGNGVYQGANRYNLKDFTMQQHKVQVEGKSDDFNWTLKGYYTVDDAGNSFDAVFTAVNLTKSVLPGYYGTVVGGVAQQVALNSGDFTTPLAGGQAQYNGILSAVTGGVPLIFLQPGTPEFKKAYDETIGNSSILAGGSKFQDKSSISHIEGQFDTEFMDFNVIAGASYRQYNPESNGTIFRDGSWVADANDPSSKSLGDIKTTEFGAFAQFERRLLDERLKLTASARFDKHENFDAQFSPRVSFVYSLKSDNDRVNNGNFRVSYQTAFRNPSLQDQYIGLDVIKAYLWGNADGFNRGYSIDKILGLSTRIGELMLGGATQAAATSQALSEANTNIAAVTPEEVQTIEVGYKSIISEKWYVDVNYYYSKFTNFIQAKNVLVPHGDNVLNFLDPEKPFRVYQVDANSSDEVESEGFTFATSYNLSENYAVNGNYSYAFLYKEAKDDEIPAFNTPQNKWNFGFTGRKIADRFGFNMNVKHVDGI
jgi:iron complex outermembrane recepter protein